MFTALQNIVSVSPGLIHSSVQFHGENMPSSVNTAVYSYSLGVASTDVFATFSSRKI